MKEAFMSDGITLHKRTLRFIAVAALTWTIASPLCAQQAQTPGPASVPAAPDGPSAPAKAEPIAHKNLFSIIRQGGVVMIPMFACSFLTLVFVFERAISLRRGRVIPGPFVKRFLHQVREGKLDRDQAIELCQESSSTIADVFAAGVKKWGRPSVEVEQALLDAGERAANQLRKYLRIFNAVATISPLLGLLGTVFGMIRLFNEISTSDVMGRTELFAGGISEALLATASGLSVAIPALAFYLFFLGRVDRLVIDIDALGQELVESISAEALHEDRLGKIKGNRRGTAA
jgi:biopolymer transport protein ExbB